MHLPLISFLMELLHLLNVSAVEGHGVVLAVLLFLQERQLFEVPVPFPAQQVPSEKGFTLEESSFLHSLLWR